MIERFDDLNELLRKIQTMNDRDNPPLLTEQEREVLEVLAGAWDLFLSLPEQHDADDSEFCAAIHAAQNIVLARPAMRSLGDVRGGTRKSP